MARTLEFLFAGQSLKCGIDKVDRAALYGSTDVETRDKAGSRCQIATLANDGRTLIPSGGTALGYVARDGTWLERSGLTAVDSRGNRLNTVSSSFDQPIELEIKTTPERFLDHSIRSAYLLEIVEGGVPAALGKALGEGAIYKFDFSYRGGLAADPAFLLRDGDDALWLLIGDDNNVNFVGLAEAAGLAIEDGAEAADSDELDFEMN